MLRPWALPTHSSRSSAVMDARRRSLPALCLCASLCLALALAAVSRPGRAEPPLEPVRLQLKWQHQFQFAGYYAAVERGYYREAGLAVELLPASPGMDPVQVVLRGEAEYGVGSSDLLLRRQAGAPVVVLAVLFQHSPLVLFTRADRDIHGPRDLAGRRVMLGPRDSELEAYLRAAGVGPERLEVVPHTHGIDALVAGEVDAMSGYLTTELYALQRSGVDYQLLLPGAAGLEFYGDNLYTTEGELREHPQRVRAFREASLRGWAYALEHVEEMVALIRERYAPGLEAEALRFEARQMRRLLHAELVEPGYMNLARWRDIARSYAEQGMLPAEFPLEGFVYVPPRPPDHAWLYTLLLASLLGLLALGAVVAYILGLNRRLHAGERRYRALYDTAPVAFMVTDRQGRITGWNRRAEEMFGWSAAQIRGRHYIDLLVPEAERDEMDRSVGGLFGSGGTSRSLNWNLTRDGRRVLCEWTNAAMFDEQGEVRSVLSLGVDVTLRWRIEQALRESEERFRLLAENAPDVIWTMDLEGRFTYVNPAVERLRGYSVEEVLGERLEQAFTPESYEQAREGLEQLLRTGDLPRHHWELEQTCKDGSTVWVEIIVKVLRDAQGRPQGLLGITRDITERRAAEAQLEHLAHHDVLTGLPNRALYQDRLEQALERVGRRGGEVALLYVDLDDFKGVNDRYGHEAGDQVLREIARRLRECVRASDTVARIGGDEFTVILGEVARREDVQRVADKILRSIAQPVRLPTGIARLGASVGVAVFPRDATDAEGLLRRADHAMYRAKRRSKAGGAPPA